eukprot:6092552-Amphidinium_carterae.2
MHVRVQSRSALRLPSTEVSPAARASRLSETTKSKRGKRFKEEPWLGGVVSRSRAVSNLVLQPNELLVEPQEEARVSCKLWKLGGEHVQEKTSKQHYRLRDVWVGKSGALFYRRGTGDEMFFFDRVPLRYLELMELPEGTTCFEFSFSIGFPRAHESRREIEPIYFGIEEEEPFLAFLEEYARQQNCSHSRLQMVIAKVCAAHNLKRDTTHRVHAVTLCSASLLRSSTTSASVPHHHRNGFSRCARTHTFAVSDIIKLPDAINGQSSQIEVPKDHATLMS